MTYPVALGHPLRTANRCCAGAGSWPSRWATGVSRPTFSPARLCCAPLPSTSPRPACSRGAPWRRAPRPTISSPAPTGSTRSRRRRPTWAGLRAGSGRGGARAAPAPAREPLDAAVGRVRELCRPAGRRRRRGGVGAHRGSPRDLPAQRVHSVRAVLRRASRLGAPAVRTHGRRPAGRPPSRGPRRRAPAHVVVDDGGCPVRRHAARGRGARPSRGPAPSGRGRGGRAGRRDAPAPLPGPLAEATGDPAVLARADELLRAIRVPEGCAWLLGADAYLGVARAWRAPGTRSGRRRSSPGSGRRRRAPGGPCSTRIQARSGRSLQSTSSPSFWIH